MITPAGGGVPRVLHPSIRGHPRWGRDGYVYYMDAETEGISRIAGRGGVVERLTERQPGDGTPHFSPHLVTEGKAVLFTVGVGDEWHIRAVDLSTRNVTPPIAEGLRPHYTGSGHLVYLTPSGDITAAPFDARAVKPTGPGVPVIRGVRFNRFYSPLFISENGTLRRRHELPKPGSPRYGPASPPHGRCSGRGRERLSRGRGMSQEPGLAVDLPDCESRNRAVS